MIAQLGTSHTYVMGGDIEKAKKVNVGLLGADLESDAASGAVRFVRLLRPEAWETDVEAPLLMSHARVKDGDYLWAVNGQKVSAPEDVCRELAGLAGRQVLLKVGSRPDRSDARDIQIKAVVDDGGLREAMVANGPYAGSE